MTPVRPPAGADGGLAVQYPASSTWVTSVGGTQVSGDSQITWFESGRASGGGSSSLIDRPSYQLARGQSAGDRRDVPDVAMLAAPDQLPPIPVCTERSCDWTRAGGTSAGAPLLAAAVTQIKQEIRREGHVPVSFLNPLLYGLAGEDELFSDITSGDNDLAGLGCCTAAAGFDLTTV